MMCMYIYMVINGHSAFQHLLRIVDFFGIVYIKIYINKRRFCLSIYTFKNNFIQKIAQVKYINSFCLFEHCELEYIISTFFQSHRCPPHLKLHYFTPWKITKIHNHTNLQKSLIEEFQKSVENNFCHKHDRVNIISCEGENYVAMYIKKFSPFNIWSE